MKIIRSLLGAFLNPRLEFRVRLFNVLAMGGTVISFLMVILSAANNAGILSVCGNALSTALSFGLLYYSYRSGRYQLCYMITIIAIFMVLFPLLFFGAGGYHSGMPSFFVFAVLFTIFMLEGVKAFVMSVLELLEYITLCLIAYRYPQTVNFYAEEAEILVDVIVAFTAVSITLGITMFIHFRMYNQQKRELETANEQLQNLNRIKTEFLQDIKHEIRTPLTAISLGADVIRNNHDEQGDRQDVCNALNTVQNEAMRLGRMINGMVELATMNANPKNRESVDFAAMLRNCAEASRFELEAKGNSLRLAIAPELPNVFAESEQLARVPANLLSNAIKCTSGGEIVIEAATEANYIMVSVIDSGDGISSELLPRVFERGVSGKGGRGYGLSICKTIVEAHGGAIEIESDLGKGTTASFSIPIYGGQDKRAERGNAG
ncbi:MAG: HAMP domain-containing histidine kinase [Clostridiales bacterium]|nr:HAMP domain-containing histidine kinase [Clostridiales bacterium]